MIIVAHHQSVVCNFPNILTSHLESTHEEADTRIILHAKDATSRGITSLDIQSPDTDVLVLSIRRYTRLPTNSFFVTGTGNSRIKISLKVLYINLGEITAAALPGFHAFTGADQTGRFAGKGKLTCWKTFLSVPNYIKEAFIELGKDNMPSPEVETKLEYFVNYMTKALLYMMFQICSRSYSVGSKLKERNYLQQRELSIM